MYHQNYGTRPELDWCEAVQKNRRHTVARSRDCRVRSSRRVPSAIPRALRTTESGRSWGILMGHVLHLILWHGFLLTLATEIVGITDKALGAIHVL